MTAFTDACDRLLEKILKAENADERRQAEFELGELLCDGLPPEPFDPKMAQAGERERAWE